MGGLDLKTLGAHGTRARSPSRGRPQTCHALFSMALDLTLVQNVGSFFVASRTARLGARGWVDEGENDGLFDQPADSYDLQNSLPDPLAG